MKVNMNTKLQIAFIITSALCLVKFFFLPQKGSISGIPKDVWKETGFFKITFKGYLLPANKYGHRSSDNNNWKFVLTEKAYKEIQIAMEQNREVSLHYDKYWYRLPVVTRVCLTYT